MSELHVAHTDDDISYLLSTQAIRERASKIYAAASGDLTHFEIDEGAIESTVDLVIRVTRDAYPTLDIPFHSRWGHFQAGESDRLRHLDHELMGVSQEERVRAKLDLVVVSVLLDAGAGMTWRYLDRGASLRRSEGLAVASFRMFMAGDFSSEQSRPLQADAEGLRRMTLEHLARGFQANDENPLIGLEGRLALLHALGDAIEADGVRFGVSSARPGRVFDYLVREGVREIRSTDILDAVLRGLGSIWPGRLSLGAVNLGDVWSHSLLGAAGTLEALIPFHKLSQWLTYSMIEPIEDAGVLVLGVDELTGLAEYRNGGLFVDTGLLRLRDQAMLQRAHAPDSELIVEWRALTVHLLDRLAPLVRERLGLGEDQFPLAKVLEGGTWRAGRRIAADKRPDGAPPIRIESDGTVF